MQIRPYRLSEQSLSLTGRVLVETLRLTRTNPTVDLDTIRLRAGTTAVLVERILAQHIEPKNHRVMNVDQHTRFGLAQAAVQVGMLDQVARVLTWQEFEAFGESCLAHSGFQTWKGLIVRDETRRWQIDLAACRGSMILSIDCKHWNSPNYPSKLRAAAHHQRLAMPSLTRRILLAIPSTTEQMWTLPIILTLSDPRSRTIDGAVLLSVGQLSDFLDHVSPYDPDIPFVSANRVEESSISSR